MQDPKLARVNVVGSSGSGKSTFSKLLAQRLGHPRIEMDQLFWEPNWKEPTDDVFFKKLETALDLPNWVLDGNYSRTLHIKWKKVTAVVWLDYSFPRVLFQALNRAIWRAIHGKELWPGTGNRDSFGRIFFSRGSIILWTLKMFPKMRRRYQVAMSDPTLAHIQFIRLKSHREAKKFLDSINLVF